jgi:hypothetical protein
MKGGRKKRPHESRKKKGRPRKAPGSAPPSKQRRKKLCGAETRSGKPCRKWAMANGRCKLHGGKSLKGREHPSFKTGLHSRYLSDTLKDVLEAEPKIAKDLADADLQGVDDEIRLVMAMLMLHMKKRPADSRRITLDWIKQSVSLIDELTKQKERRYRMQKELRTITLEELQNIIRRYTILVYTAVENEIQNESLREKLLARLQAIPEQVATSLGS